MEEKDEKKVVKQEISEEDLNVSAGAENKYCSGHCVVVKCLEGKFKCNSYTG